MSGSRHTPGPWRLNLSWDADSTIVTVEGEPVLQQVAPDAMHGGVDALDEDLQLMATAPELLEALKQLRDEVREWNVVLTGSTAAKQRAVLELADTVVARAEGREHLLRHPAGRGVCGGSSRAFSLGAVRE